MFALKKTQGPVPILTNNKYTKLCKTNLEAPSDDIKMLDMKVEVPDFNKHKYIETYKKKDPKKFKTSW